MKPIQISIPQLTKFLKTNTKGSNFCSLLTYTECKLKKDAPVKELYKISKVNVNVGFNYTNAVKSQMKKEGVAGGFKSKGRAWGSHVENTPLIEHKGNYYLETRPISSMGRKYFIVEGDKVKVIDKETAESWIQERKEAPGQPVEKKVIVRDYKLGSLLQIKINKQKLRIQ